jgi:hypothetical protein
MHNAQLRSGFFGHKATDNLKQYKNRKKRSDRNETGISMLKASVKRAEGGT